jgi:hypothetical protein
MAAQAGFSRRAEHTKQGEPTKVLVSTILSGVGVSFFLLAAADDAPAESVSMVVKKMGLLTDYLE